MLLFDVNMPVLPNTIKFLEKIKNTDALERGIATTLAASNKRRIHNEGKAVDGTEIGQYREITKRIRSNPRIAGFGFSSRQIAYVDLFFSSKLSKDFDVGKVDKGWGVGFLKSYGERLRKKHEDKYKKKIWGITEQDRQDVQGIVNRFIQK